MAMEIECEIKDGQIKFDVKGGSGKSCTDITKDLENALGKVVDKKHKTEFYQRSEIIDNRLTRK